MDPPKIQLRSLIRVWDWVVASLCREMSGAAASGFEHVAEVSLAGIIRDW